MFCVGVGVGGGGCGRACCVHACVRALMSQSFTCARRGKMEGGIVWELCVCVCACVHVACVYICVCLCVFVYVCVCVYVCV